MMKRLNLNLWEKVKTAFSSSDHAFNTPLFLLLLFLLPTQFGRHFWFPFSYIHGLRLDYVAITLYTIDVLLLLLLSHVFFVNRSSLRKPLTQLFHSSIKLPFFTFKTAWICVGLGVFIFLNTVFSQSLPLTMYGWLKVFELSFFVWYTYQFCLQEKRLILCMQAFLAGISLQALLAILQYYHGGSLGGLWYFLGERFYSGDTPGIANASIFGQLVLRPYGTLPHPNVLAAFLLIGLYFLFFSKNIVSKKGHLMSLAVLGSLFLVALILTLSRTALFLLPFLCFSFLLPYLSKQKTIGLVGAVSIIVFIFFPMLAGRFGSLSLGDESVIMRGDYIAASFKIIRSYPLLGTGLYSYLPTLGKTTSEIRYDALQPVHSVFLLMASELGIPFALIAVLLLCYCCYLLFRKRAFTPLILVFLIIVLSSFDHYFWTLQQGELLFAFCLAQLMVQASKSGKKIEKTRISSADKRKI